MNYYYLISSLPDLSLDGPLERIDFDETFDAIQRNLEPNDLDSFNYLLYPNDNRNLLSHLFHEYKDLPKAKFEHPCTLTSDVIQSYRREQSSLPDYMVEFLTEFEVQFPSISMREMENRLQQKFQDQLYKYDNPFITRYHRFKHSLSELVAVFNRANHDYLSEPHFQSEDLLSQSVKRGQSLPSSVLKTYPFAEQLKEVVSTTDPSQIERFVEQVEWDYLTPPSNDFGSEQVLAYAARLLILFRKKKQDLQLGASRFMVLKNDIRNKVHSPKTPVV